MLQTERRRRRSEKVVEALSYQLSHVKEQEQLLAFVLADRDGLLVASAPSSIDGEALSALCPLLHRGEAGAQELRWVLGEHQDAKVAWLSVQVNDEELFLFSVGESDAVAKRAVQQAGGGVQRIFTMFSC
jgi:predicted regulator of Ras-like GTPase activity (Roadblock/LC7/MglB family)